jgi:predicted nicotinamide N-methyase
VDWAAEAIDVLERNAARNRVVLRAVRADWRAFHGEHDLALAADVLYEARYVEPLLEALPGLAPAALLAEPGRPHAAAFLERARERWTVEPAGDRVHRLTFR